MDNDTIIFGALRAVTSFNFNTAIVTMNASLADLSGHPGFSNQPQTWCSAPPTIVPQSVGYFSISMPADLSETLLLLYDTMNTNPLTMTAGVNSFPSTIIIEKDSSAAAVVQLASQQNGSVIINAALLLSAPAFPTQLGVPLPASVTLDLSGCVGCMSLSNSKVHVYLANLHLTGLERPVANSSGDGAQLSLPLWAFQFNRSSGTQAVRLHLRNVTLTLPQDEFTHVLVSLPGAQQLQLPAGGQPLLSGVNVMVSDWCRGWGGGTVHCSGRSDTGEVGVGGDTTQLIPVTLNEP